MSASTDKATLSQAEFAKIVSEGIPNSIPSARVWDNNVNHAPLRKDILSNEEKLLAVKNALRYFPKDQHAALAPEFAEELQKFGRIYMYRYRPDHDMYARPIDWYPGKMQTSCCNNADDSE
jgi:urocanate hydratase